MAMGRTECTVAFYNDSISPVTKIDIAGYAACAAFYNDSISPVTKIRITVALPTDLFYNDSISPVTKIEMLEEYKYWSFTMTQFLRLLK